MAIKPTSSLPYKEDTSGKQSIAMAKDELYSATFTIAAEGGNAIVMTIQFLDGAAKEMTQRNAIFAYLSDDANGDSVTGTGPSTETAIATDGVLIPLVAKKAYTLISESDGDIGLTFTETGDKTWYLVLVMPDGRLVVSGAIDFD